MFSFFKNKTSSGFPGLVFLLISLPSPPIDIWKAHCAGQKNLSVESWVQEAANTREWRGLTHFFDSSQSDVAEGTSFFVSKDGHHDLAKELEATVCEILNPTRKLEPLGANVSCAFPARSHFLKTIGAPIEETSCRDFLDFYEGLKPKSLTYVFSSAYPNNPASMFGHTFIRLNQGAGDPLLDYGVNYAAQIPEHEPGYLYIPGGLLGLYPGTFQVAPYYRKVLEYNQAESRDLWEYDFNLSEADTIQWVRHLYELRFLARFHYSFLKQNCSYQLLRSVQAIHPVYEGDLGNYFYVLPGGTVNELHQNLDTNPEHIHFRPSLFKVAEHRFRLLNHEQQSEFKKLKENPENGLAFMKDPMVLEALISDADYEKIQEQEYVKESTAQKLRGFRLARARLGGTTNFAPLTPSTEVTNRPDLAHGTRNFGFYERQALQGSGARVGVSYRFALHDLLEQDAGYEPLFGLRALDTHLSWDLKEKKLALDELTLVQIISLQAMGENHYPLSWQVESGWKLVPFEHLSDTNAWNLSASPGVTFQLSEHHLYTGLFLGAEVWVQSRLRRSNQLFGMAEPWILWRVNERLKFKVEVVERLRHDLSKGYFQVRGEAAYAFTKEAEFKVNYQSLDQESSGVLQAAVQFFY